MASDLPGPAIGAVRDALAAAGRRFTDCSAGSRTRPGRLSGSGT